MRLCRDYSLDRLPTFDRMSVRSHPTGTKVLSTKNADPLPASTTQQERLAVHLADFIQEVHEAVKRKNKMNDQRSRTFHVYKPKCLGQ